MNLHDEFHTYLGGAVFLDPSTTLIAEMVTQVVTQIPALARQLLHACDFDVHGWVVLKGIDLEIYFSAAGFTGIQH